MAHGVCPWWLGYLLASPLRKLIQNPDEILSPYVQEGMTVLDVGSAMGYFSIPMARLVGPAGKVICVDLQEKMIASLKKRVSKAGLTDRVETRVCDNDSLKTENLATSVDFALAFALVHEHEHGGLLILEVLTCLSFALTSVIFSIEMGMVTIRL